VWMERHMNHICASVQEAIVDNLLVKTIKACRALRRERVVLAGGVACNERLREKLTETATQKGLSWTAPPPHYCTDNAAMIAVTAWLRHTRLGPQTAYNALFPSRAWYTK
jgi:N6-L-threonylcarbamoyladenine synthase